MAYIIGIVVLVSSLIIFIILIGGGEPLIYILLIIGCYLLIKWTEKMEKEGKETLADFFPSLLPNSDKTDDEYEIEIESGFKSQRKPVPQKVKDEVWNRDGGKCVQCGSNENLEFDHIIPHSKGGADTYRNLQLLCEPCNRSKSNKIG